MEVLSLRKKYPNLQHIYLATDDPQVLENVTQWNENHPQYSPFAFWWNNNHNNNINTGDENSTKKNNINKEYKWSKDTPIQTTLQMLVDLELLSGLQICTDDLFSSIRFSSILTIPPLNTIITTYKQIVISSLEPNARCMVNMPFIAFVDCSSWVNSSYIKITIVCLSYLQITIVLILLIHIIGWVASRLMIGKGK